MEELRLGVIESQFAEIIWSNEPLPSGELVKLCDRRGKCVADDTSGRLGESDVTGMLI